MGQRRLVGPDTDLSKRDSNMDLNGACCGSTDGQERFSLLAGRLESSKALNDHLAKPWPDLFQYPLFLRHEMVASKRTGLVLAACRAEGHPSVQRPQREAATWR